MSTTYAGPLHVLQDSGPPGDATDYTTLVLVHGYAWHSGIFSKLIPLAESQNVRIILLNRRDYPGAVPYTEAERELLSPETTDNASKNNAAAFMKERARELHDYLTQLVKNKAVASLDRERNKGGIILAGWSFGTTWILSLLAHVASFPVDDVKLGDYMRSVAFLDPPYLAFGYPALENQYNPLFDPDILPNDRDKAFANWVSGYYVHGDTPETLEPKVPLQTPLPTLSTLTPEEIGRTLCLPVGGPGGSDSMLLEVALKVGLFATLRKNALYTPQGEQPGETWDGVEVRYIWCERSVWEMPWGTMLLKKEIEAVRTQGSPMRSIRFVYVKGGNHFVHWDQPELALHALVGDEDEVE